MTTVDLQQTEHEDLLNSKGRCRKHPRYQGKRPPRVLCPGCAAVWAASHSIPEVESPTCDGRPHPVLCDRSECRHCERIEPGVPIEDTKDGVFTPAWPHTYMRRCTRKNVVITKDGHCDSFTHHHPDIMRPAVKRRRHSSLGTKVPESPPSCRERVRLLKAKVAEFEADVSQESLENLMTSAYRMALQDQKRGIRVFDAGDDNSGPMTPTKWPWTAAGKDGVLR